MLKTLAAYISTQLQLFLSGEVKSWHCRNCIKGALKWFRAPLQSSLFDFWEASWGHNQRRTVTSWNKNTGSHSSTQCLMPLSQIVPVKVPVFQIAHTQLGEVQQPLKHAGRIEISLWGSVSHSVNWSERVSVWKIIIRCFYLITRHLLYLLLQLVSSWSRAAPTLPPPQN